MCGFVGIIGVPQAASALGMALQSVQHRGQDAAGVGTWDGGFLQIHKDVGMVGQVITKDVLGTLGGQSGIGHVRYPTAGSSTRGDAQPFMTRRPSIILAHNGNVTNVPQLERELLERGLRTTSHCDSEPILLVLGDEMMRLKVYNHTLEDMETAVRETLRRVKGSYSVAAIMEVDGIESMVAFRDPHGIRPASYGRNADGAWLVCSETVCLDVLDFEFMGHVPPGAMMIFRPGEEPIVRHLLPKPLKHCVFEDIYFARPDSLMETGRVYGSRRRFGIKLAEEWRAKGHQADVVVAVPDTSRPAAQAMAEAMQVSYEEGFIKNRYSGRTFIMPDQATRDMALRLKLNPIPEIFEGRRVVLVDDSIVRGSTMRRIVQMIRKLNPTELHVAIFSPAVRHPCFYGIDMPTKEELVAAPFGDGALEAHLADRFGADSVTFLSRKGLGEVAGNDICAACFTGEYPVPVTQQERGHIRSDRRA